MIHENETADEKSYYSDYDEETDEELEKELPDATGKKKWNFLNVLFELFYRPLSSLNTIDTGHSLRNEVLTVLLLLFWMVRFLISEPSTFADRLL